MLRRDIFNLLFTANRPAQPDLDTPDPVVHTPEYLLNDHTAHYSQEWNNLQPYLLLQPDMLTAFAFSISFSTNAASAALTVGIREGQDAEVLPITFGIREGALFIAALRDKKITDPDKVKQGVLLILDVKPQPGNRSYAKLQLQDQSGLTISVLKTSDYSLSDWEGAIHSSGAISSISITGRRATAEPEPITTLQKV
jgi:hypothetical protein